VQYEVLQRQEAELDAFFQQYDATRVTVVDNLSKSKELISALLEAMSKSVEEVMLRNGASLDDLKGFKEKTKSSNQNTIEGLKTERKKRQKELDLLTASEPKLLNEIQALKEKISFMQQEMVQFEDIDSLHEVFDELKNDLQQKRQSYIRRRDLMKVEVSKVAIENEAIQKSLAVSDTAKELEELEKRMRHSER
jgi:hypothetical protein